MMNRTMDKNRAMTLLTLLLVLVAGTMLRIYGLDAESMTLDEVYSIRLSENSIPGIISGLKWDAHPPVYFILLHYWVLLFGSGSTVVRLFSVFWGVLAIFLSFRVATLMFHHRVGLWTAALVALSPFLIQYSQQTRAYELFLCLVLVSYYYLIKVVFQYPGGRWNRLLYAVSTVAVLYTHVYGLFIFLAQIAFIFLDGFKKREIWRAWIVPGAAIVLLYSFWLPVVYFQAFKARESFSPKGYSSADSLPQTLTTWSGSGALLLLLAALIVLGLWGSGGEYRRKNTLLILWMAFPVLIPMLISLLEPMYHDRYTIGSAIAFYLLASQGISRFKPWRALLIAAGLISLFYLPVITGYYHTVHKEDWRSTVQFIEKNAHPDDAIIAAPAKAAIPIRYYFNGQAPIYPVNPHHYKYLINLEPFGIMDDQEFPDDPGAFVRTLLHENRRVWLVVRSEAFGHGLEKIMAESLGQSLPILEKRFRGVKVFLYQVPS